MSTRFGLLLLLSWLMGCQASEPPGANDAPSPAPPTDLEAPGELDGRWMMSREARVEAVLSPQQREAMRRLDAIGYLGGSQAASERIGVTVHDAARAQSGLNLYSSGHAPEAHLMTMDGEVLHTWRMEFARAFPDLDLPPAGDDLAECWRRVRLLEGGDLLAIFEGRGILRLDRDSKLLWSVANRAHHDVRRRPDGTLLVLTREPRVVPAVDPTEPILEDFMAILTPEGKELRRVSMVDAFLESEFRSWFDARGLRTGDILHTNALWLLDGTRVDAPWNAPGHVLTSMRTTDTIAVVDLDSGRIVQAWHGPWKAQHEPRLLPNGNLLLFDNKGQEGRSRVLEFHAVTDELRWAYQGSPEHPFYSATCGTASRLANGNTLVVESDNGRAFEVLPSGEIVWEFHNPARAGARGQYVATLFDVERIPAERAGFLER